MEDFYSNVMGMVVSDRGYVAPLDMHLRFLTLDPLEHHQLVLASGRTEGAVQLDSFVGGAAGSAINQVSFELADLETLRQMRQRLRDAGCVKGVPTNHGNAWALYVRDIEGNPMELFVATPWYIPQPFGHPLDLRKPDDEILAETEALCRAADGFEPLAAWQDRMRAKLAARAATPPAAGPL